MLNSFELAAAPTAEAPSRDQSLVSRSEWSAEIDGISQEEWARLTDRFADANLYQTWAYGSVRWSEANLSHLVLRRRGEAVAIAQLRILRPMSLPVGIAYLRWGPLFHPKGRLAEQDVLVRMARVLREEYVGRRKLYLRIVPNACEGSARAEMFRAAFAQYTKEERSSVLPYRTIFLDLTYPIEVLRERLSPRWRRQLLRAERNALRIRMGNAAEDFRIFQPLYSEMRRRKGFHSTVSVEEFARIQEGLPERHRMKVLLCEEGGRPVAGIVVSVMGESALYLLGATSGQGLDSRGSYLLHWTLIEWLRENEVRYYDLGGINPENNPGGYDFKKGFSGADVSHVAPYSACDSFLSGAFVRTGDAVRSAIRECDRWIHRLRNTLRAGELQC